MMSWIDGAYNVGEILLLCLIGIAIVIVTLIVLIALLTVFSKVLNSIGVKNKTSSAPAANTEIIASEQENEEVVAAVTAALLAFYEAGAVEGEDEVPPPFVIRSIKKI